jgi:hypothetical protein
MVLAQIKGVAVEKNSAKYGARERAMRVTNIFEIFRSGRGMPCKPFVLTI